MEMDAVVGLTGAKKENFDDFLRWLEGTEGKLGRYDT